MGIILLVMLGTGTVVGALLWRHVTPRFALVATAPFVPVAGIVLSLRFC